ncbi:unnamed protein product [Pylaiella littoralis]
MMTAESPLCALPADGFNAVQCILCECQCSQELQPDVEVSDFSRHSSSSLLTASAAACNHDDNDKARGGGTRGGGEGDACVLYQEDGGIATLTVNRPKSKNSFSRAVFSRLAALLETAERRESVLAVVLTGAGEYFTSGADIKELQTGAVSTVPMLQQPFGAFSTAVLRFPKLLVAAVNGPAVGVGVTLLPHCDVVYANGGVAPAPPSCSRDDGERRRRGDTRDEGRVAGKDGASFWTPFFRLAIVPEFCSSVTFPEVMGMSLSNEMLILGRKLSAQEALASGLVSTVVTADSREAFLLQVKDDLRRTVLETPMATESVRTFKRIMWRERRPRMLRVLAEECVELDRIRRMQAGDPREALKYLTSHPASGRSKL